MGRRPSFDAALAIAALCLASPLAVSCASYAPSAERWASLVAPGAPAESTAAASDQGARTAARREAESQGRDPGSADYGPFAAPSSARPSVTSLQAELVRRRGGEWVIVSLTPQERAVLALWLLIQFPMSTREISERCGMEMAGAWKMLNRISRVVPLYREGGKWRILRIS